MYEQANKLQKDLKLDPHLWEGKYKMKMNELKLLAIKNQGQNLKCFSQTKLSFAKAKPTSLSAYVATDTESNGAKIDGF